jgi:uncharacterized membrane protein YuzA (DUF378 family)
MEDIMRSIDVIAAILLVVGGINWGLIGLFNFDLIQALFGSAPIFIKSVYTLVGVAAVYQILSLKGIQTRWNVK